MEKKLRLLVVIVIVVILCMAAVRDTTISEYKVLYQNTNVAGAPDTTLLTAPTTAFVINAISDSSNHVDLRHPPSGDKSSHANNIQLIFMHGNGTGDADGTTSVFELWGQNVGGARQAICTIVLTGGKARPVASANDDTWADTAVVTSTHSTTIAVADNAADRIVSVSLDVTGFRYLQGLFTGAGSTSVITTAYFRYL